MSEDNKQQTSNQQTDSQQTISQQNESNKVDDKVDDLHITFSYEYVKSLREENKTRRLAVEALEKDISGLKGQMKSLVDASVTRVVNAELRAAAVAHNLIDLDSLAMFDTSKLKILDTGIVEGVEVLFEEMKGKKPYLFNKSKHQGTTNKDFQAASETGAKKVTAYDFKSDEDYKRALNAIIRQT
jgi:hypothetical protein